ncbi:MAG: thioredoxin family protein, partial [Candidatus Sumerlaeia bacterium]|nr:thioredoxin family protein [Candidatus Sumerlaeia bacterium]
IVWSIVVNIFGQVNWQTDLQQTLALAKSQQKPALLYFYTPFAEDCKRFEQETLSNPQVVNLLNQNFICLRVNAQQDQKVMMQYGLYRVPTVVVLEPSGREVMRLITYYPPDKLISSLTQFITNMSLQRQETPTPVMPTPVKPAQAIFYDSFETLYGWGCDRTKGLAQISLVKGIQGNAIKLEYELPRDEYSYVQVHRILKPAERIKLPEKYTVSFYMSGSGGVNEFALKFEDDDGTNFGTIILTPVDGQWRKYVFTSDDIKYLWGGRDQILNSFAVLWLAVSSRDAIKKEVVGGEKGTILVDELSIVPGIQR